MSWQTLFPTFAAAQRYLSTIRSPEQRDAKAAELGVDLRQGRGKSSPPAAPVLDAFILPIGLASDPRLISSPPTITLTLPYPPSTNRIWRSVIVWLAGEPRIRVLLSKVGRTYRRAVQVAVQEAGSPRAPHGRLTVKLVVCAPDKRIRDVDNVLKGFFDGLTHAGVWADDSLIDELHIWRGPVVRRGCLLVAISPCLEVQS